MRSCSEFVATARSDLAFEGLLTEEADGEGAGTREGKGPGMYRTSII
jgi:hypothetical protein